MVVTKIMGRGSKQTNSIASLLVFLDRGLSRFALSLWPAVSPPVQRAQTAFPNHRRVLSVSSSSHNVVLHWLSHRKRALKVDAEVSLAYYRLKRLSAHCHCCVLKNRHVKCLHAGHRISAFVRAPCLKLRAIVLRYDVSTSPMPASSSGQNVMSIRGSNRPISICNDASNTHLCYSAFLACSRSLGAVLAFFSRSAAHRAAPTVLVKIKSRFTNGIISRRVAARPKLPLLVQIPSSVKAHLRSISSPILLNVSLPLSLVPLF